MHISWAAHLLDGANFTMSSFVVFASCYMHVRNFGWEMNALHVLNLRWEMNAVATALILPLVDCREFVPYTAG